MILLMRYLECAQDDIESSIKPEYQTFNLDPAFS
jgi:hypothetical protein